MVDGNILTLCLAYPVCAQDPDGCDETERHTPVKNSEETAICFPEAAGLRAWAFDRYPFELSGGQRRRRLMALGLAGSPRILIADESATGQNDVNRALGKAVSEIQQKIRGRR